MTFHQFVFSLNCENAAFDTAENEADSIASLLTQTAADLQRGNTRGKLKDLNGNTVGQWGFRKKESNA